jgi:hypothetical protein
MSILRFFLMKEEGPLSRVELRLELQDGGLEKGSGSLLNFLLEGELLRRRDDLDYSKEGMTAFPMGTLELQVGDGSHEGEGQGRTPLELQFVPAT